MSKRDFSPQSVGAGDGFIHPDFRNWSFGIGHSFEIWILSFGFYLHIAISKQLHMIRLPDL
jgi:hypothetical protein